MSSKVKLFTLYMLHIFYNTIMCYDWMNGIYYQASFKWAPISHSELKITFSNYLNPIRHVEAQSDL